MILELKSICKKFSGITALQDIDLSIAPSSVHALVGENGAGKSTLIKICTGAHTPDSGSLTVHGVSYTSMTPRLSGQLGIAAIYQEFNLVKDLTVAENIFLGRAIRKGICIQRKAMNQAAAELFSQLGVSIDPQELVGNLNVGYQQIVEITKAVSQKARVLIMDEPTAPLSKSECERLFTLVNTLKKSGVAIVYITHRMNEIFLLSDTITVLRDGRKISSFPTNSTNQNELISLMVNRAVTDAYPPRTSNPPTNETIAEALQLSGNGLHNVTLSIKRGEILGLSGLMGSGRTEFAQLLFGIKQPTSGIMHFKGKKHRPSSPKDAMKAGIALVPEDRKQQGALLSLGIRSNISITCIKRLATLGVISQKQELQLVAGFCKDLQIKAHNSEQLVKNLSGGNQQKVVIAKWLATYPDLIILDEPTRGIDVGARFEMYLLINKLVAAGKTVLMISSEIEELMGMADRIIVLHEGKISGELLKPEFSQEKIMAYASGITESCKTHACQMPTSREDKALSSSPT